MRCVLPPIQAIPDGLAMPATAWSQDGVFTRSQARAEGWSDRTQRRLLDSGLWIAVAGTVMRHREVPEGPWQLARAVHLTAGLVASHATAGALCQLAVPAELHGIGHVRRVPARVSVHRVALREDEVLSARGLLMTSPARTLTDLLCTLGEEGGVTMLTDGFRRAAFTSDEVLAAARSAYGRPGVTLARHLAYSCRREPHSPLEWRFHGLTDALGPGWRFNVDIHDDRGFVGRVDALHEASATIVELDSRRFHGEERFQSDRTRDQRLAALGYVVIRLTWDDVEHRPMDAVERIRRTVAVRTRGSMSADARAHARRRPGLAMPNADQPRPAA